MDVGYVVNVPFLQCFEHVENVLHDFFRKRQSKESVFIRCLLKFAVKFKPEATANLRRQRIMLPAGAAIAGSGEST